MFQKIKHIIYHCDNKNNNNKKTGETNIKKKSISFVIKLKVAINLFTKYESNLSSFNCLLNAFAN